MKCQVAESHANLGLVQCSSPSTGTPKVERIPAVLVAGGSKRSRIPRRPENYYGCPRTVKTRQDDACYPDGAEVQDGDQYQIQARGQAVRTTLVPVDSGHYGNVHI